MKTRKSLGYGLVPSVLALTLAATSAVQAAAVAGSSNAYGLDVNVGVIGLLTLDVGPFANVSGTAPSSYNVPGSIASVNASTPLLASATTGLITTSAISNVDGLPGVRQSSAQAVVNGLNLNVLAAITGNVLSVGASTITSSSSVSGDVSSPVPTSSSVIENLAVSALGSTITIPAEAYTTPNYVLVNAGGISIILNETITNTTATSASVTTNAIHISLTNVAGLSGLVTGDIIVGHSFASQAIPEPAAITLGFASLGLLLFRKRRMSL
jgi:hypothetical protein